MYYAHSAPLAVERSSTRDGWEPLRDHLHDVADLAACFAEPFGAAPEARLAGLLHDLGKYSDRFTLRLENKDSGLDHWSAGARVAFDRLKALGAPVTLAIQGHHIGLQGALALQDLSRNSAPQAATPGADRRRRGGLALPAGCRWDLSPGS